LINTDPVNYANQKYETAISNNNTLKFGLLKYIRESGLSYYKPKGVLRVLIPKPNGKVRPLGIPSIHDRPFQMLIKLVIDPYLERLGEEYYFGFRAGRKCNQITAYIHNRLHYNRSNRKVSKRDRPYLEMKARSIIRDTIVDKTSL